MTNPLPATPTTGRDTPAPGVGATGLPIADTPGALTPEWLTAVLRAQGSIENSSVVGVDTRPLGTGQMCDSYRVGLTYDTGTGGPRSLIAKLPAADETSRATAKAMRNYEKEVRFYQVIKPTLAARIPTMYYADIDPETASFALLLEDLSPATQGDQLQGCTPEIAETAVMQLVPLHTARWNDPTLLQLDWLVGDPEEGRARMREILPLFWAGFQDRYRNLIAPHVREAGDTLLSHADAYLAPRDGPTTITHNDYRLDNLLFTPGPNSDVAGIVDWQTCSVGPGPRDVAYFIGAGLLPDDRRKHEVRLVRSYHDGLVHAGVAAYSWDRCWHDYRAGTWGGLVMAMAASMLVERTERGDEMFLCMADRHALHALDLHAADTLT